MVRAGVGTVIPIVAPLLSAARCHMAGGCDGVAAVAPSPAYGGNLRKYLRHSAQTGTYGPGYVTADVAKCTGAFE